MLIKNASPEEREHLDFLLSLRLLAATQQFPPLLDLMDDISRNAQERGLTPEMLEEILRDGAYRRQELAELTHMSGRSGGTTSSGVSDFWAAQKPIRIRIAAS